MISRLLRSLSRPDVLLDLHLYGGLLLAAVGGWQLSPAWTLVLLGLAVSALGLWSAGARRGQERVG